MRLRQLSGCMLHAQLELLFKQFQMLLLERLNRLFSQFASFHDLHHRPNNYTSADRQLRCRQTEGFAGNVICHTFHFIEHLAGLDLGYPVFHATLTLTHTHRQRLLGDRLVREHADPDFATTLDVASHGTTRCFDLTCSQTATVGCLQTNGAKRHLAAPLCQAAVTALVHFAEFCTLRLQHRSLPFSHGGFFCCPWSASLPGPARHRREFHHGRSIPSHQWCRRWFLHAHWRSPHRHAGCAGAHG